VGKFDHRSRDQKRKARLKKRAERSRKRESLAYHGSKYRNEKFIVPLFRAEVGIYEAYVMSERSITDETVEDALVELIHGLRDRSLPPVPEGNTFTQGEDEDDSDLIIWNIRRNWQDLAEAQPLPRTDDLVGILRSILHSLEIWHAKGVLSRGYLNYLEGFLNKSGVSVRVANEKFEPLPEPPPDPQLDLGRRWIEANDREAGIEFKQAAEDLLRAGSVARVVEVAQRLIGETGPSPYLSDLERLALRGHQALGESGSQPGLPG
jgi:hypothetical protein